MAESDKIKWYKIPVEKELLRELATTKSDLKGLLQAGSFLLVFLLLGALSYYFFEIRHWVLFGICFFLHGTCANFMGMEAAVHELSHGTAFKSKKLNEFFYKIFCFISWNNWVHFRYSHRKHHHLTTHKGKDYEVILEPMKFRPFTFISLFIIDIRKVIDRIRPSIYHFLGSTKVDFFSWDELFEKDDPNRQSLINWARILIVGHVILIALFIYFKQYVLIVIFNFSTFFASWLSVGCGKLQHAGLPSNESDWRKNCYTFYASPIIRYLYWNMNYHIEHHSYASVPFYNLGKLHKAMRSQEPQPLSGYFSGLLHLFRVMTEQMKNPEYCYQQKLPEHQVES